MAKFWFVDMSTKPKRETKEKTKDKETPKSNAQAKLKEDNTKKTAKSEELKRDSKYNIQIHRQRKVYK